MLEMGEEAIECAWLVAVAVAVEGYLRTMCSVYTVINVRVHKYTYR